MDHLATKSVFILMFIGCVYGIDMMGGMEDIYGGMYMKHPYSFGYQASGIMGDHYRKENADERGIVKGTYGYQDAQGLYRTVDYVAGPGIGFQAHVNTNEPGTIGHQHEHPSHVIMQAQKPPPGVQTHFGSNTRNMMSSDMSSLKFMGVGTLGMMGGGRLYK